MSAVRLTRRTLSWAQFVRRFWRPLALGTLVTLVHVAWFLTRPGMIFGPEDGTWLRSQINKDLYVGIDPSYPPFAQWTPERIEGIEADIAREIGARLGVETSILIMGFDGLYDALYTGTVDFVISGLRVDPGRTWVHYTSPYFEAGLVIVSRSEDAYQTMAQLDRKTLAVEMASAGDITAQKWTRRLHTLTILRHLLPAEAMQAVRNAEADAALVDTISARLYAEDHADLVIADSVVQSEGYVIALRKENFKMIDEVEQALESMKNDGSLEAILERWL